VTAATFDPRPESLSRSHDQRFFRTLITVMAGVLVSGFIVQLAAGRSSFGAPLYIHAHAVVLMGWVGIVVTQAWLAGSGDLKAHKALGMVAALWMVAVVIAGTAVTLGVLREMRSPFFFQPQHFMIANIGGLPFVVALFGAAVALRRRPDWHMRLHTGAFMLLMGPGFGRLLPAPMLMPWAFEISAAVGLVFAAVGMGRDLKVRRSVHPAWWWCVAALVAWLVLARLIGFSPLGEALYQAAMAGSPAAGTNGLAFPPPPPM
jgi:hypothetical protein